MLDIKQTGATKGHNPMVVWKSDTGFGGHHTPGQSATNYSHMLTIKICGCIRTGVTVGKTICKWKSVVGEWLICFSFIQ
jgi:hypothetical protein